jgi:hydrogenase-4 component B
MNVHSILTIGIACFISAAAVSLLPLSRNRNPGYLLSAIGAFCFLAAGGYLMAAPPVDSAPFTLSSVFQFAFHGDALSGFFVVIISLVTLPVSVYSLGFTRGMRNAGLMAVLFSILILSMYAVVLAGNLVTFLVAWETMAVSSYLLVVFERNQETARAGLFYVVMTHIGTAFIIALFLILSRATGSPDFSGMKAGIAQVSPAVRSLVFLFAVVGFGTKAGIVPLHAWIPRAYPVAPSNITPLMSGLMIKTAVYGILRIVVDVLGPGPEWWGITMIVLGGVSAILGILYALMERDIKVFLAYSSVENIGIIFLGLGAAMMFTAHGLMPLAAIALTAALFHVANHALFKGLLFLGAGAVVRVTETRNMEKLGGLLKTMPYTGFLFLLGSLAICALPPLNGFASEWLTYQSLLLGFRTPSLISKIVSPLGGAALALTGAMVAAGFVKTFGTTFLGMPRTGHAEQAREASWSMVLGMAVLAALCVVLGLFPGAAVDLTGSVVFMLTGTAPQLYGRGILGISQSAASISPLAVAVTMLVGLAAALLFIRTAGGKRKTVSAGSWDCGMPSLTPRMQYTATAFTKPIRIIFKRIYLPRRELKVSYLVKPFFVRSIQYGGGITPFFERYVYEPATRFIHAVAGRVKLLQSGSLNLYLGYILITLILLLIFGT